jgi:predicted ATPase
VPYLLSANPEDQELDGYPFTLPAVRTLGSIELSDVTLFVGDNGTGKSTIIEALAVAAGFNAEGGSRNLRFETFSTHSSLADYLTLGWNQRPRWGWFLRAETFYGVASHIHTDDDPESGVKAMFPDLHNRSHGESFLPLIESRMSSDGLYFLDEPESALSFHGQLRLLAIMLDAAEAGAQFVVATHSPVLMAFPRATIYEFGDDGANSARTTTSSPFNSGGTSSPHPTGFSATSSANRPHRASPVAHHSGSENPPSRLYGNTLVVPSCASNARMPSPRSRIWSSTRWASEAGLATLNSLPNSSTTRAEPEARVRRHAAVRCVHRSSGHRSAPH